MRLPLAWMLCGLDPRSGNEFIIQARLGVYLFPRGDESAAVVLPQAVAAQNGRRRSHHPGANVLSHI